MSARPRPVTATVTHQPDFAPFMPRSGDLSSGSETASLVSVLDHDSYVSPDPSDSEEEVGKVEANNKKNDESKADTTVSYSEDNKENTDVSYTITTTTSTSKTRETSTPSSPTEKTPRKTSSARSHLRARSPWEKWMIEKAKDIREQQKLEAQRLEEKRREEEKKLQEKKKKEAKVAVNVAQWQQKKAVEVKLRLSLQKEKERTEKELKQEEQKQIEEKANVKYQEWLMEKQERERVKRLEEKEKKKEEERKKEEQRAKSEKAFQEWKQKAKKRPCTAPNSYGYIAGQLTSYHDRNSYPAPSFYNPMPWMPIHVPQPKEKKPKPKTKPPKTWNPGKYL